MNEELLKKLQELENSGKIGIVNLGSPNISDVHIDKFTTNLLIAYTNKKLIHDRIFNTMSMTEDSGKIPVAGNDHLRVFDSERTTWDENGHRIEFAVGDPKNYSVEDHDIQVYLPYKLQKNMDRPFEPKRWASLNLAQVRGVILEKSMASLFSAGNFTSGRKATPTVKWDDPTSDPIDTLRDAIWTVESTSGKAPNTLLIGKKVAVALRKHPALQNRMSGIKKSLTMADLMTILKEELDINEILMGNAIYNSSKKGQPANLTQIWGDIACPFYKGTAELYESSFGYRFIRSKGNSNSLPIGVSQGVRSWQEPIAKKGDVYELDWAYQDKVLDTNLGYLLYGVLS